MTMLKRLGLAFVLFSAITCCPLLAQTTASSPPDAPTGRRFGQPCWEQAGISSSVMPQIRQIHHTMRTQAESVHSDSSLSSQQKQQKIRQLRQEAHQQMDALVGPQQLEALRSCQENRRAGAQKPIPQQP